MSKSTRRRQGKPKGGRAARKHEVQGEVIPEPKTWAQIEREQRMARNAAAARVALAKMRMEREQDAER